MRHNFKHKARFCRAQNKKGALILLDKAAQTVGFIFPDFHA
jgi:hypothetical protein